LFELSILQGQCIAYEGGGSATTTTHQSWCAHCLYTGCAVCGWLFCWMLSLWSFKYFSVGDDTRF